jgi:hypothetical protein
MANRTIECGECGESVPYGRLSCPACGALLAAVTRASASNGASATSNGASATTTATRASSSNGASATTTATPGSSSTRGAWRKAAGPASAPVYLIDPVPDVADEPALESSPTPWPPLVEREPVGTAAAGEAHYAPPDASLVARPQERLSSARASDPPRVPPPGAYLPPSSAASIALTTGIGRPAPGIGGPTVADPVGATTATVRAALPSLDAARVGELAGWLVAAGSAMAALGFVLPWSVAVIGARGYGGYLDGWGLASPTHVLALSVVLLALALGVVKTTVPAWLRTGVLGLALGGLLIGLTWPYAVGPLGADIGAMLVTIGGLALVVGGGLALWSDRHAGSGLSV